MLPLFLCITDSLSLYIEEINLFANGYWVFHVSEFLRLFMMSFKYGLFKYGFKYGLLTYSSTNSVLSILSLLSYSI